jgi:hypothetical protein
LIRSFNIKYISENCRGKIIMDKLKHRNDPAFTKPAFWFVAVAVAAAVTVACGMTAKQEAKVKCQIANAAATSDTIVYKNARYGFLFTLPESWKGFTIVTDKWEGVDSQSGKTVAEGPIILIRSPQWTFKNPRQDIPVMIFTVAQWNSLQNGEFHIGAAPIGPTELGRNSRYVFALPARYNFAFLPGYEEVEKILAGNPLHPVEKGCQSCK